MKKSKQNKQKSIEKVAVKPIKDLVSSLQALSSIDQLLRQASFQVGVHSRVQAALGFLSVLHRTVLEEALVHPEAGSVPEFKPLLDQKGNP